MSYSAQLLEESCEVAFLRVNIQRLVLALVPHIGKPTVSLCIASLEATQRSLLGREQDIETELRVEEWEGLHPSEGGR